MKNLNEYITTKFRRVPDSIEMLPNINEHLKSLDPKVVCRQMSNRMKGPVIMIGTSRKDVKKSTVLIKTRWEFRDNPDLYAAFCDNLDLMMWHISQSFESPEDRKNEWWELLIEPIMAANMTDYVYGRCGGILYHICPKVSTQYIEELGLRVKGRMDARKYPHRCYLIAADENAKSNILMVLNSKTRTGWKKWDLLKIDVNGTNINFYHDPGYRLSDKGIVYAYSNIPNAMVTKIDIEKEWHRI